MKTLVLLSGGVDSAVCLARLRGTDRIAVGFDYGQPHTVELEYAATLAKSEGVPFRIVCLPSIPKTDEVIFAARNGILIAYAVSIAVAEGASHVVIGTNQSDHAHFPDCRIHFLSAIREAMSAYGVKVLYPLAGVPKQDVMREAKELGLNLNGLWTCYTPANGKPCGVCMSCTTRGPL